MADRDLTDVGEINALLGRGTAYRGKLMFEGQVRIDGEFEGEIASEGLLIVGEGAVVNAKIDVGTLIVRGGRIEGEVVARELVEVHAPGEVHGDLTTPQLFVDRGVVLDGQCHMRTPGDDARPVDVLPMDGPAPNTEPEAREPSEDRNESSASSEAPKPKRRRRRRRRKPRQDSGAAAESGAGGGAGAGRDGRDGGDGGTQDGAAGTSSE